MPEPEPSDMLALAENLTLASHRRTNTRFRKAYIDYRALRREGDATSQEGFLNELLDHFETCPRRIPRGDSASKYR